VRGTVKDPSGKPIVGAVVTLRHEGKPDAGPGKLETNGAGAWSYMGLTGGMWQVTIEKEGYVPSEGTLQVSQAGAGARISVELRPAAEVAPAAEEPPVALTHIQEGNTLLGQGRPAEARAKYEEALALLPQESHVPVLQGIASTHLAEKEPAKAVTVLQSALALAPQDADVQRTLARAMYEAGDRDGSIALLEKIVVATQDTASLKLLIDLLVVAGREADAERYMAQLPAGETVSVETVLNAGIKLYNEGNLEGAMAQFDRAVQENASAADPYFYRGLVHLASSRNQQAAADFRKFLELAPEHEKAGEAREFLKHLGPR
jgi:tetratricopeptide (TPR) repeat protein